MRPGGRLVSTTMPPDEALAKAHGVEANIFYAKPYAERLGDLVATIVDNGLKVVIDRQVPMDAFDEAWAHQTSGRARGKIVVSLS